LDYSFYHAVHSLFNREIYPLLHQLDLTWTPGFFEPLVVGAENDDALQRVAEQPNWQSYRWTTTKIRNLSLR